MEREVRKETETQVRNCSGDLSVTAAAEEQDTRSGHAQEWRVLSEEQHMNAGQPAE